MKTVRVYCVQYNRPEFVQWQFDSLTAHLKTPFELVIVNNAVEAGLRREINNLCAKLNIRVIETKSGSKLAGKHHSDALNYAWKHDAVNHNGYCLILDGDCFLIKSLDVNEFMSGYIIAGPRQKREKYHYLTPSGVIIDMEAFPEPETLDWEGIGVMDGEREVRLDSGGGFYNYFRRHPEIKKKCKDVKSTWHIKNDNKNKHCIPTELISEYEDNFNIEFFGNEFCHYCKSSDWDQKGLEHHNRKTVFFRKFLYRTIDGTIKSLEHNFQIDNSIYFGWEE